MKLSKKAALKRRHRRSRKTLAGSAARPRLFVRKTSKHLYAQVIDDGPDGGSRTIVEFSTWSKETAGKHMANVANASALGKRAGESLKAKGIGALVFDRGGNRYHGVIKAIADGVREAGIQM